MARNKNLLCQDNQRLLDLAGTLSFGKHKGKTIPQVMDSNPQYLVWAHEVGAIVLTKSEHKEALVRAAENQIPQSDVYEDIEWGECMTGFDNTDFF